MLAIDAKNRICKTKWGSVLPLLLLFVSCTRPEPRAAGTFHVDRNNSACKDDSTGGSEAIPYCTVKYAATTTRTAGDTIIVHEGKYGEGIFDFKKDGTEAAPITWRAQGKVILGHFHDIDDLACKPSELPKVYQCPLTLPSDKEIIGFFQNYFNPIIVDDDNNPSLFTMIDADGPLKLNDWLDRSITNDELTQHEGTARRESNRILIHPYGDRVPSPTTTDFVQGYKKSLMVEADWNIFEGFTIRYTHPDNSLQATGKNNTYRRMTFEAVPMIMSGGSNKAEDIIVRHSIQQGENFNFFHSGQGSSLIFRGSSNRLTRARIYHNWNATVSLEKASWSTIDGVIMHGSPNHCGVGTVTSIGVENTFRNFTAYNCQDYTYWGVNDEHQSSKMKIDHATLPSEIGLQTTDNVPITGPITITNSLIKEGIDYWVWNEGTDPAYCKYEANTTIENSIMSASATIHDCESEKDYNVQDYIKQCQAGTLTNCVKFNNVTFVTDWKTVLKDGMWGPSLGDHWDFSLIPGSPALDIALAGATQDIWGTLRPQGLANDSGAFELMATVASVCSNCGHPKEKHIGIDLICPTNVFKTQ